MTTPDPQEQLTTANDPPGDADKSPPPAPGSQFGGYQLIEIIGQGGMGVVYKARQEAVDRLVALKIMRNRHSSPEEVKRFSNEARAIARLVHPKIVRIHDVGQVGKWHYLACELIRGTALDQIIAGQPMAPDRALEIVAQLAEALDYAHQKDVIHRDLKPSNVLIDAKGVPHLTDFGLARRLDTESGRLTQTGEVVGTPAYMSPEQVSDEFGPIAVTTDVHGLGTILYELLTGRPPFSGENMLNTLHQVLYKLPPAPHELNPEVPPSHGELCLKCLAKNPTERHPTARAVAIHCRGLLAGLVPSPVQAPTTQPAADPSLARPSDSPQGAPTAPAVRHSSQRPLLILLCLLFAGICVRVWMPREATAPEAPPSRKSEATAPPDLLPQYIRAIESGDEAAAFEVLARHLAQRPNDWEMRSKRIDLARQLKRIIEVFPDLKALDAAGKLSDLQTVTLLEIYRKQEQHQQAAELMRRVVQRNPALASRLALEQAREHLAAGKPMEAARTWLQAPRGSAPDPLFLSTLEMQLRSQLAQGSPPSASLNQLLTKLALRDPRFFWPSLTGWFAADPRRVEPLASRLLEQLLARYCRNRKYDNVGRAVGAALRSKNPTRAMALSKKESSLAKEALEQRRYGDSVQHLTLALWLTPVAKSASLRLQRAHAYALLRQRDRAFDDFTIAVKLNPQLISTESARTVMRQDMTKLDEMIEACTQAIKINPQDSAAYVNRGMARQGKKDLDGAIKDFTQAIKINPQLARFYSLRGSALQRKLDLNGAINDFNKAIEINPQDSMAYMSRGMARQAKMDMDGAIKDFTQTIKIDPRQTIAYSMRGIARLGAGDPSGAIADFTQAIKFHPEFAALYSGRGSARQAVGDLDGAIADYTQAIEINPAIASFQFFRRALVRAHTGKKTMALEDLQKATKLDPEGAHGALWLAGLGYTEGTARLQRYAHGKDWSGIVVRFYLGQISATELLRQAQLAPTAEKRKSRLCSAYCHLGLLAERAGKPQKAGDFYRSCLATGIAPFVTYGWAKMRLTKLK